MSSIWTTQTVWAFHCDRVPLLVTSILHSLVFPMYFMVTTGVVSWSCRYSIFLQCLSNVDDNDNLSTSCSICQSFFLLWAVIGQLFNDDMHCYDHVQLWVLSGHSSRIAVLQPNSGRSQLFRSRSRRYASVKYDPWTILCSFVTTPRRLPCPFVSSPWTWYILYLVAFSPELTLFYLDLT